MTVLPMIVYDGTGRIAVIVKQYKVVDDYTVFLWLDVLDRAVLWQGRRDRVTGNMVAVTEPYRLGRGEHRLLVRSSLGWRTYPYLVVCSNGCVTVNTWEPPVYRIPRISGAITISLSSGNLRACSSLKAYNIPSGMSVDARWTVNVFDCGTYDFLGVKTMNGLSGCMDVGVGGRDCALVSLSGVIDMSHGYNVLWETNVRVDRRVYRGVPVGVTIDRKWYEPLERLVGEEVVLKPTVPVTSRSKQQVVEKRAGVSPYKALFPLILVGGAVYLLGRRKKR